MTTAPNGSDRVKRRLAVILASDVAGYSRLVADDEEGTVRRLGLLTHRFRDLVAGHDGRVFNTAGDAVLAEFSSAVDGVRCALDVQDAARAANLGISESRRIELRIGIALGDVIVTADGDLLGDGVNIAARLESLSAPGGICVSDEVRGHVQSKIAVDFRDLGLRELKNIPNPVRVYRVGPASSGATEAARTPSPSRDRPPPARRRAALALRVAVPLSILIGCVLLASRSADIAALLRGGEVTPVQRLAAQIDFGDVGANIDAVIALASLGQSHREYRDEVIETLKGKLVHQPVRAFDETSRAIKRSVMVALVKLRSGDLRNDFSGGLLNHQDLVGIDLRKTDARGAQLRDATLIGSDFREADLGDADLSDSALRGSRFDGAKMAGTGLSGADWFNAWGLMEGQLRSARSKGLRKCPTDADGAHSEQAFIDAANVAYGIRFENWSIDQQDESRRSWASYATPNGPCDLAN